MSATGTSPTTNRRRETLDELRDDRIPQLQERENVLEEKLADALDEGEDPTPIRKQLAEVREELDTFRDVVPELERRLKEEEREQLCDLAEDRLQSIKKTAGGVVGEVPRRIERARELADQLTELLRWLYLRPQLLERLGEEADLLAGSFGLDRPEMKSVADLEVDPQEAARTICNQVSGVCRPRMSPGMSRRRKIENMPAKFGVQTPTPELLERLEELDEEE